MNKRPFVVISAVAIGIVGTSANAQREHERPRDLTGSYVIQASRTRDGVGAAGAGQLQLEFSGQAASDMFHGLGAWTKVNSCRADLTETRDRGDVRCSLESGRYSCVVGFDLTTGRSRYSGAC